ncbi:hypothetical protein LOTGIDRAFT_231426 [Lottia gigantea]|uniref:EF-hand domain-containing protein n=1 Tax=Lottia gigantea TaxID=225164 RepID=V4ATX6_LOTGI|nr:hypothetical protein LOTGIDRAFT_231426 [Lottia gigantea]ESO98365.1 hypothetical protein LOTGIDRAFT_231426 [Lottia gigantea]
MVGKSEERALGSCDEDIRTVRHLDSKTLEQYDIWTIYLNRKMKVAVVLIVVLVVMMIGQETDSWRIRFRRGRRLLRRIAPFVPIVIRAFGKRQAGDAEFQAKYNAAAEDGVFTDEEIKSVFGVDDNGLVEFKATYDVDGDGVVQVEEYETVVELTENLAG